MKINAVIFDLDGVLISTDEQHYEAWNALCEKLGIPFSRENYRAFRGVSRMECMNLIEKFRKEPFLPEEKVAYADWKNTRYRALLAELSPDAVSESTRNLLALLRDRGFLLAVGSSSCNARYILERVRLKNAFDAIVDGTDIQNSKPDPEVFLKAATALGVSPDQCVVVEDAAAGIQAALSAGMIAVAIGDAAEAMEGDAQICALPELAGVLDAFERS